MTKVLMIIIVAVVIGAVAYFIMMSNKTTSLSPEANQNSTTMPLASSPATSTTAPSTGY